MDNSISKIPNLVSSKTASAVLAFLFVFVGIDFAHVAMAQTSSDPVVRGRDAFNSQGEWDWYDGKSDSLKPMNVPQIPGPNDNQNSGNSGQGGSGSPGTGGGGSGGTGGGGGNSGGMQMPAGSSAIGGAIGPIISTIAIIIVVLMLIALIAGVIWAIMKMDFSKDDDEDDERETADEVELAPVDKLPFEIDKSIGNFLDAARQAYQQQDFRMATIYLFSHTLLTLDQNQYIRLTRGKTNRQYLSEIRDHSELKRFFESVMIPFEAVFFGDLPISKQQFESCWSQVDRFHNDVNRGRQPIQPMNPQFRPMPA